MSVSVVGPPTDRKISAECRTCELPWIGETPDQGEAQFLVGVHNDLHHAGRDEAVLIVAESPVDAVDELDEDADEL
ncbi:hypothetical protein LWF15_13900 [Kineosporia rhizophila]|uniref:hypothetical protein n=1 Tax=Kineosporia rhizophila TaxID=84633 RepID=UPI000A92ECCB|nr:hypothetical protein [Kineosporia rhizophila]MCE0536601.1 hypothetical protein [Kineosporia rhizophila]